MTTFTPAIKLDVSNETLRDRTLTVEWELRDASGKELKVRDAGFETRGIVEVKVPSLSSEWLLEKHFHGIDIYSTNVSFRARDNGKVVSEGTVLFVPAKYFLFEDPCLKVTVSSDNTILVEAGAFAKNVEIRNEDDDLILSDNFFDMDPGSRQIEVLRGNLRGLRVRSVYDIH